MEICIPPQFNNAQKKEYIKRKKAHTKYKFLLKYVAENIDDSGDVLNMEWQEKISGDNIYRLLRVFDEVCNPATEAEQKESMKASLTNRQNIPCATRFPPIHHLKWNTAPESVSVRLLFYQIPRRHLFYLIIHHNHAAQILLLIP